MEEMEDNMKKVITYGTFDLFHEGHYNILKRAKEYGDYLIVGVTGENYDAQRGKLSVHDSLSKRIENVRKTGFADLIIVEEYIGQKIYDIIKYGIDVLVVGSDWKGKFDHLSEYCEVKYLERTKNISSTQIRNIEMKIYRFGIVTDDLWDNKVIEETKTIHGLRMESVFASDMKLANQFAKKFKVPNTFTSYDKFLESIDILYIKTSLQTRVDYIEKALIQGKHVISSIPPSLKKEKIQYLRELSKHHHAFLLNNIPMLYLNSFSQLVWMARSNMIGNVLSIRCSISKNHFTKQSDKDLYEVAYYPICTIFKIMGTNYKECTCKYIRNKNNIVYMILSIVFENSIALVELGENVNITEGITITGTMGKIYILDKWWNLSYFKMKRQGEEDFRRFSFHFEGNGFRYILQFILQNLRNSTIPSSRISEDEMLTMINICKKIKMEEKKIKKQEGGL